MILSDFAVGNRRAGHLPGQANVSNWMVETDSLARRASGRSICREFNLSLARRASFETASNQPTCSSSGDSSTGMGRIPLAPLKSLCSTRKLTNRWGSRPRRLTQQGFESRFCQPKQNAVTFADHRVVHAEDSRSGIRHRDRSDWQPFGHLLGQLSFGRVVLAVHRTDFRRQRATAHQFVSHQHQHHRPNRFAMLVGGRRKGGLQFLGDACVMVVCCPAAVRGCEPTHP